MKLKMAPNSLFAVLLRSPWWISFALVGAIALASGALLPPEYVPFGVMGGFPFLVIGSMAAWRQLRAPAPRDIERTLEALGGMSWREFSEVLTQAYARQGFSVQPATGTAADLQLHKNGQTTLVAARRWKAANQGVEPLRALARARSDQDASHCTYVALGPLGDAAQRFAKAERIDVLSGQALALLAGKRSP